MYTLVVVEVLPMIYLALGLTLIGLFSQYKVFLLFAIGPILVMIFDYEEIHEGHVGVDVFIITLAAWLLFNVYAALLGGKSNE